MAKVKVHVHDAYINATSPEFSGHKMFLWNAKALNGSSKK